MDATIKVHGKLDVLVNNAGIFVGKGVEDASLEEWHKLVAVNLTGVLLGTRAALPHLKKTKGNIVNLASIAGLVGSQLDPLYSLTKGGVTLFTKSTALEFGRKGYGIRVNSIHPGLIETDMGQQTFVMRARQVGTNDTEQARKNTLALHPIGRLGVAEDIAKGIVFLASDDASFMTGAGLVGCSRTRSPRSSSPTGSASTTSGRSSTISLRNTRTPRHPKSSSRPARHARRTSASAMAWCWRLRATTIPPASPSASPRST